MLRYVVRPISDRTPFTGKHARSNFDASWPATEQLLDREVRMLRGRDLVIECDVTESQIRVDGGLYSRATPRTPAIRVAFNSVHGPLVYATDRFAHWQDNVRAIALGLEALRKVDRYGITKHGEQYTGWKAIGSGAATPMPASHMTASEADDLLWKVSQLGRDLAWPREARWKKARARAHPDRNNGDRMLWDQVEQAAAVLGLLK